jgi:hypothetical protein
MTDVVTDMINAIVAAGHATGVGLDIFAMYNRPMPVSQIAVLPTGGLNPKLARIRCMADRCTDPYSRLGSCIGME